MEEGEKRQRGQVDYAASFSLSSNVTARNTSTGRGTLKDSDRSNHANNAMTKDNIPKHEAKEEIWSEYKDEVSGSPYYYEHNSGRSVWEPPKAWKRLSLAVKTTADLSRQKTTRSTECQPQGENDHQKTAITLPQIVQKGNISKDSIHDRAATQLGLLVDTRSKTKLLSRLREAAKKIKITQRFIGTKSVRPINMRSSEKYVNVDNNCISRKERNRFMKELGVIHPAVLQQVEDEKQRAIDRLAAKMHKQEDLRKEKEKMLDMQLEEAERLRLRTIPGTITLELMGEYGKQAFTNLDEALAAIPPRPAKGIITFGTGTYTFVDRPIVLDKDVILTRKRGVYVRIVFRVTKVPQAYCSQLLRMRAHLRAPNLANKKQAIFNPLFKIPCFQLSGRGAQLRMLHISTNIQCGAILTTTGTAVQQCEFHGGGLVVRMDNNVSEAEGRLVNIEGNIVQDAYDDGMILEGRSTCATVVDNVVKGSDGYGMWIRYGACPSIKGNQVIQGQADGIAVWHALSIPAIASNKIANNAGNGLSITKRAQPSIKDNTIAENGYAGVWLRERARGSINLNRFARNKMGAIRAAPAENCDFTVRKNQGVISVVYRTVDVDENESNDI